jgi:hypothetical protein
MIIKGIKGYQPLIPCHLNWVANFKIELAGIEERPIY